VWDCAVGYLVEARDELDALDEHHVEDTEACSRDHVAHALHQVEAALFMLDPSSQRRPDPGF
jgi:hypothetical protein